MTLPRRQLPDQCVMITRRCIDRRYLLRPDEALNDIWWYEFARASSRYGQSVHAAVSMSNHMHACITDHSGDRSLFMQYLMKEVSSRQNRHLDRKGAFWEPNRQYGDLLLLDRGAIERKLLYVWMNPVAAGLVETIHDWPGFVILPKHWGKTITLAVPASFYGRRSPKSVTFSPQPPPGFEEMSLDEVRTHFEQLIRTAEEEIKTLRKGQPVRGVQAVLAIDPLSAPTTEEEPSSFSPRFSADDKELIDIARQLNHTFVNDHERARRRLRLHPKTRFPAGTVRIRRQLRLRCAEVSTDEPGLFPLRPRPSPAIPSES